MSRMERCIEVVVVLLGVIQLAPNGLVSSGGGTERMIHCTKICSLKIHDLRCVKPVKQDYAFFLQP